MLEDDAVVATKRTGATTSDRRCGSGDKGKGKRSRQNRDVEQERGDGVSVHSSRHRGADRAGH